MSTQQITPEITPAPQPQPQEFPVIPEAQAFSMPLEDLKAAAFAQPEQVQAAPAPAVQQQQPQMYTVEQGESGLIVKMASELGGETFKGANWDEVGPQIAKAKAHANAFIKQRDGQLPQFQADPQAQPEIHPNALAPEIYMTPEQEAAAQEAAFDFLRKELITPELKKQIVSEALGVDQRFLPQTVQQITQANGRFQQEIELADFFRDNPTYVDTPENSTALLSYFPADFQQRTGRPHPSAIELRQAFAMAKYERKISAPVNNAPQPRPPLMPSSGSAPPSSSANNPWTMEMNDLKKQAGLG